MATVNAPVLIDFLPKARVRDLTLVKGGAVALAVTSQVLIPLWFTPVPISLATFTVLLVGAAFGPARAGLSVGLYLTLGVLGAPIFAGFASGVATASFGYVVGYLAAALVVGRLAQGRADRRLVTTFGMAALGSALIYLFGVPWLMFTLGVSFVEALMLGVVPFLFGDAIKALLASLVLPTAWRLVGDPQE